MKKKLTKKMKAHLLSTAESCKNPPELPTKPFKLVEIPWCSEYEADIKEIKAFIKTVSKGYTSTRGCEKDKVY